MNPYPQSGSNSKAGMFLYAKLVLLDLHACMTLAELLDYIKTENFPPGLAQAYVHTEWSPRHLLGSVFVHSLRRSSVH